MLNKIIGLILIATAIVIAQDSVYRPGQVFTLNSGAPPVNCTIGSVYIRTNPPASISVCSIANIWDDLAPNYLSSTWTPALSSGGGTLPSFVTNLGTYTRIGNSVFYNIYLNNVTGGTTGVGANQLSISLPVTTGSIQLPIRIPMGSSLNGTNAEIIFGTLAPSSSTMLLWKQITGPSVGALNNNDFQNANIRQINLTGRLAL